MGENENSKEGDYAQLHEACLNYKPVFMRWAYKNHKYKAEKAEDLFKDTLIRVHRWFSFCNGKHKNCRPESMLIQFANGLIVDEKRKKDPVTDLCETFPPGIDPLVYNDGEEQLYHEDLRKYIKRYLAILSNLDQQIMCDFFLEGLEAQIIAVNRNLTSADVVWQRISRSRKTIREHYGHEWCGE